MASGICVIGLVQRGTLLPSTYELLTAGRKLADGLKCPLTAVLVGAKSAGAAQDVIDRGAEKAYTIDHASLENFNDEIFSKAVSQFAEKEGPAVLLLPATVAGRSLAARLSVSLKAGLAAEVAEVSVEGGKVRAKRPHFSGNLNAELEFKSAVSVLTVAGMAYPKAVKQSGRSGETVSVAFEPPQVKTEFVSFNAEESNEIDLGSAEKIVSGGRGLGSAEGFKPIRELAHLIGAAVGASRAAVDSGWIPYRHQVGLTGRAVRPKLYIACGVSGQIQHLAGMSSSDTIVAINTDKECPLMQMASISVEADTNEFLPLLIAEVKKRKGGAVAA